MTSSFRWIDRHGIERELDTPEPIDAEADEVAAEIDEALAALRSSLPQEEREKLRAQVRSKMARLQVLQAESARWNEHAAMLNRARIGELREAIDELERGLEHTRLVVALFAEELELSEAAEGKEVIFAQAEASAMTTAQREAIAKSDRWPKIADDASRDEARRWLADDPDFARTYNDDGGWFAWRDMFGNARRLSSPLSIEVEIVAVADELQEVRLRFEDNLSLDETISALDEAPDLWERFLVLQGDLERFAREAEARENEEWDRFATDWRSRRKKG